LVEISEIGMHNYFTDTFKEISSTGQPFLLGVYDVKFDEYVLHIQKQVPLQGTYQSQGSGAVQYIVVPPEFASLVQGQTITITYTNNLTGVLETTTIPVVSFIGGASYPVLEPIVSQGGLPPGTLADNDIVTIEGVLVPGGGDTVAFNEKMQKWVTFYSYSPEMMSGAATDIVSFQDGKLYRHNENPAHNNFYDTQFSSEMHVVSNQDPDARKVYLSLVEKSNKTWAMYEGTNQQGQKTNLVGGDFEDIEGDKVAALLKDENSNGGLVEGEDIRDNVMTAKLRNDDISSVKLFSVGFNHVKSEGTNK
jgi:hypothetical protein